MFQFRLLTILILAPLLCHGQIHHGINNQEFPNRRPAQFPQHVPNPKQVTARPTTTTTIRVDKIRDVEAVDPGLLSPPVNVTPPLGKQFNSPGAFGGSFAGNFGGVGNSIIPEPGFGQFSPGVGQTGPFVPGGQVGAGFPPTQVGGFPVAGTFPGAGLLPGSTPLPPGSVAADTVAFSAARASDFTRTGITQVRFDFTLTDVGYGWYPDRSEFVCYYPGLYYFTFNGLSPQTRQFKLSLVKNNQEVVSSWGDTNGYQMGSNSAILALNQGDRVYLILQEGNLHETPGNGGRGYTSFSGFRIR